MKRGENTDENYTIYLGGVMSLALPKQAFKANNLENSAINRRAQLWPHRLFIRITSVKRSDSITIPLSPGRLWPR